ncbi:MAG TPA: DUF4344 domain-containing metallopeptidase [Kofleriaceae bacterium]|nr:DUF4344 domain-containing metallopeptidase [Kofleriaceae bacterium]
MLAVAFVVSLGVAACKKKDDAAAKGSTTGSGAAAVEDDPWDPKPRNADAPPPPLASKLGAGAGDELAKLGGPADSPTPAAPPPGGPGEAAAAPVTVADVSTQGLPTQAVRGFAGISQTGFRVAYAKSANQTHDGFRAVLEQHKVFELVAQGLNQTIRMPRTVDIHLVDCGAINAFYDPNHSRIIVCYELLSYFVDIFKGNVANDDQLGQAVIGATLFGFYHELGHALIHQLDLPAMGREEDSADQIATLLLMEAGDDGVGMALSGAYWFHLQSKAASNETPFWDEHAFDAQRYYNILCMIYGSNPTKYAGFVDSGNLPKARAQRCTEEFVKIRSSFQKLIAPHLTNNTPQEIEYTTADPTTVAENVPEAPNAPTEPAGPPEPAPDEPLTPEGDEGDDGDQTGAFDEPTAPEEPAGHAITCEQVAEKAIELIATEAEKELAKLTPEQQEKAIEEIKANLPAFLEQFLSQCQKEDWPDKDRKCVLDAANLAKASKCGIE